MIAAFNLVAKSLPIFSLSSFNLSYYGLINRYNLVKTLEKAIKGKKPSLLEIRENEY